MFAPVSEVSQHQIVLDRPTQLPPSGVRSLHYSTKFLLVSLILRHVFGLTSSAAVDAEARMHHVPLTLHRSRTAPEEIVGDEFEELVKSPLHGSTSLLKLVIKQLVVGSAPELTIFIDGQVVIPVILVTVPERFEESVQVIFRQDLLCATEEFAVVLSPERGVSSQFPFLLNFGRWQKGSLGFDRPLPFHLELPYLGGVQTTAKTTMDLRLVVALKAKHAKVLWVVVRRIFVDMVNLYGPSGLTTNAAATIGPIE